MYINEVANHIGEHWLVSGCRSLNGRGRIDGVEVIQEKTYGYQTGTRNVRMVKVTFFDEDGNVRRFDPKTGEPDDKGEPRTALIQAKDLAEPWADYWGRELADREAVAARRLVIERLNAHLPEGHQIEDNRWRHWSSGIVLTTAAAGHLADLLDVGSE